MSVSGTTGDQEPISLRLNATSILQRGSAFTIKISLLKVQCDNKYMQKECINDMLGAY